MSVLEKNDSSQKAEAKINYGDIKGVLRLASPSDTLAANNRVTLPALLDGIDVLFATNIIIVNNIYIVITES